MVEKTLVGLANHLMNQQNVSDPPCPPPPPPKENVERFIDKDRYLSLSSSVGRRQTLASSLSVRHCLRTECINGQDSVPLLECPIIEYNRI